MSIWVNPLYKIESRGRGPQGPRDAAGWLLGRGAWAKLLRLLPLIAVVGGIATARIPWPGPAYQSAAHLAFWVLPLFIAGFAVLVGSGMAAGRDWQDERVQEWIVAPMDRSSLVGGKVWGWVLPAGAALTAGALPAAIVWAISQRAGWGIPLFAPLEGVLLIAEAWAVLYLVACVGNWAGNHARRAWAGLMLSLVLGLPLLAAVIAGLFFTLDLARLGGHLMIIGAAWFLGSFFHGWTERKLK